MVVSLQQLICTWRGFFSIAVLLLSTFSTSAVSAQRIDSLKALLANNPHDTVKVDIYLALNNANDLDEKTKQGYLDEAISLSKKTGDPKRICRSYLRLARKNDYEGDLKGAREALGKVGEQLQLFHDTKIEASYFYHTGVIDYFEGLYTDAVTNIWKALRLYEERGDSLTVASCYLNIGNCYRELDNTDKTLEYYLKAMTIYEKKGNVVGAAMAYGNLGNVYRSKGEPDTALSYFNRSLDINRKNNLLEEVRVDLNNIGNLYLDKGENSKAGDFFQESYDISVKLGSDRGVIFAKSNMGIVEMKSGHHSKAIQMYNEALTLARASNYKEDVKDIYELLSLVYEQMGRPDLALDYRKKYEVLKDSLINVDYLNQVKEQELKYETEKKDKQIQILAKEKEIGEKEAQRQSTLNKAYIGGIVFVILLAGLIGYTFFQRVHSQKLVATKNEEIREISFRRQLGELEMKALRAQINPHFLFNCMNSINKMILNGETENASLYLTKFSKLVRLILENAERTNVSLENELSLLESYIQLEELRFKGKIGYKISVDESLEKENTFLPSMVLQPFVENAIWHGLMHKQADEKGIINIQIREENDRLLCTIEDNGVGRERAQQLREKSVLKNKSMGMKITEERLRLLSQERLEQLIRVTDLKDALDHALGTRVEINIPLG